MPTRQTRRFSVILLLFVGACLTLSVALLACEQAEPFDRKAMLLSLATDVVLPSYDALGSATKALHKASEDFCKTPDAKALASAREAWLGAKLAWKRSQIFRFGPAESLEAIAHIDYWPSKTHLIEQELASTAAIDASYIDNLGASRRGLPAIEYLLFDPDKSADQVLTSFAGQDPKPQRRCKLLIAYADGVARRSQLLHDAWKQSTGDERAKLFLSVINKDKSSLTWQPAIDEIINEIVFVVQVIIDRQLGEPLGHKTGGTLQPETAEAHRSARSLACIRASLESVQRLYIGTLDGKPAAGKGISGLLVHRSKRVDDHVQRDLNSAFVALDKLKQSSLTKALQDEKSTVENAWEVLKLLQTTFRAEVVGDLGVILTFSDLDGD